MPSFDDRSCSLLAAVFVAEIGNVTDSVGHSSSARGQGRPASSGAGYQGSSGRITKQGNHLAGRAAAVEAVQHAYGSCR